MCGYNPIEPERLDVIGQLLERVNAVLRAARGVLNQVIPALLAEQHDEMGGAVTELQPDDDRVAREQVMVDQGVGRQVLIGLLDLAAGRDFRRFLPSFCLKKFLSSSVISNSAP